MNQNLKTISAITPCMRTLALALFLAAGTAFGQGNSEPKTVVGGVIDDAVGSTIDLGSDLLHTGTSAVQRSSGVIRDTTVPGSHTTRPYVEPEPWWDWKKPGFYIGFMGGPSTLKPKGDSRNEDGINFRFSTEDDDFGSRFQIGYWINEYIAIEGGGADFGKTTVPFEFDDPRNGRSGTGEAEASINGGTVALLVGFPVPKTRITGFLRGGLFFWNRELESRFDVPGEESVFRTQSKSGNGGVYGAGLNYNFKGGWGLGANYDIYDVDGDEVNMISVGLNYNFGNFNF